MADQLEPESEGTSNRGIDARGHRTTPYANGAGAGKHKGHANGTNGVLSNGYSNHHGHSHGTSASSVGEHDADADADPDEDADGEPDDSAAAEVDADGDMRMSEASSHRVNGLKGGHGGAHAHSRSHAHAHTLAHAHAHVPRSHHASNNRTHARPVLALADLDSPTGR